MLRPIITLASYWLGHQALADNFLVRPCCDALFDSNQRALHSIACLEAAQFEACADAWTCSIAGMHKKR